MDKIRDVSFSSSKVTFHNIFLVEFRDAFAKLLSSGDLTEKYSSHFTTVDSEIAPILAKVCFFNHFSGEYLKTCILAI